MGLLGTIVAFGTGYVLGGNREKAPVRAMESRVRDAVGKRLPLPRRAVTDVRDVRDVMTALPDTVGPEATLVEAAKRMADGYFGDVLVVDPKDGTLTGIATDRDIIVRAIAAERDPSTTTVRSVLSNDLETVAPTDSLAAANARMRAANVRRLPVVEEGKPIGIVSLGDLSLATDTGGTLADISVAEPDR